MSLTKKSSIIGWFICLLGAIFYWYEYLLRIEPSVMVSELMKQFSVSASGFGLITAFYYYAYTPMQLAVGVLLDRYGTKKMIGLGIICCTLGSFLFGVSSSIYIASMARFFIGFGSSFAFVGVLKLGAEWLPSYYFAFLTGLATSLGMLAGMIGDISLTSLTKEIGWQNVLHIGTILGFFLVPIMIIFIKDSPYPKDSPMKLNLSFHQTFLGLKQIIKSPQMWICGLIANTLYLSLSAFAELWGIKFLQTVYNLEIKQASIACSAIFFGWLIGGPINGWLSDHINNRKAPLLIGTLTSATILILLILHPFSLSFSLLWILLFLFGCFSSTQVLCFAISKENNPKHIAATALAFTNFLVMIGGMIFQPLIGILLDLLWTGASVDNVRVYSSFTYQIVFLLIPLCLIVGAVLTFKLKDTLEKK